MCQQETQVSIPPTRGTEVAAQRGCIRAADHGTVNMACPLANQVHKSLPTGTGSTLPSTNVNSRPPCGCPPADDHGGYRPDAAGGGLFASAAPGRAGKRAHTIPMDCCCPDRIRLKIPGRRGRARLQSSIPVPYAALPRPLQPTLLHHPFGVLPCLYHESRLEPRLVGIWGTVSMR